MGRKTGKARPPWGPRATGVGCEGGEVKGALDPWLDPSVVSGCLLNGGASPSKCPLAGSDCLSPCPLLLPSSSRCPLMPVALGLQGHTWFTFCHKGGVICISEVIDISPSNLDSTLCFFQSSISYDVLCIKVK